MQDRLPCQQFTSGAAGYLSGIPYTSFSKFGQTLINFPLNEQFGARTNVTSSNWGTPSSRGLYTDSKGQFFDCLLFGRRLESATFDAAKSVNKYLNVSAKPNMVLWVPERSEAPVHHRR